MKRLLIDRISLFAWLIAGLSVAAPVSLAASPPRVFLLDASRLEAAKQRVQKKDPKLELALARLERDAGKALGAGPFTVTSKEALPPSGDKRDYMSQAPYFWPDPAKPNGLPYIRRDGERNTQSRSSQTDTTDCQGEENCHSNRARRPTIRVGPDQSLGI